MAASTRQDPLADLIAASARGDREAFAVLYRETSARLLGIALRTTGRRDLAEEVLQEAFLAIWRNAARFDPARAPAHAWMVTIVRRRAIDRLREESVRTRPSESVDVDRLTAKDGAQSVDDLLVGSERRVRECLAALDEQRRQAILLAFHHGLTHGELAERLDAKLGTVKSWIRRGLRELRECIEA